MLALIVLGPERLPQVARTAGKWVAEARKLTASLQSEMKVVVDEVMAPVQETGRVAGDAFTSASSTFMATDDPTTSSGVGSGSEDEGPGTAVVTSTQASNPAPLSDFTSPGPLDPSLN